MWAWGRNHENGWTSNWTLNYLQGSNSRIQGTCRIGWYLSPTKKRGPGPGVREVEPGDLVGSGGAVGQAAAPHQPVEPANPRWHLWGASTPHTSINLLSTERIWLLHSCLLNHKQNFSSDPSQLCKEENSGKCSPSLAKLTQYTFTTEKKKAAG